MNGDLTPRPLRVRIIVASVLALISLLLMGAEYVSPGARSSETPRERGAGESVVAAAVDTMFARYAINKNSMKSWQARSGGHPIGRIEQRVSVGPDFLSLNFNHELNGMLAACGAHVVASEKTRDNIVTMHIVRGGATVRSIICVTESDHEKDFNPRKGESLFRRER